jgi:uracil phosphoribosyltransferase
MIATGHTVQNIVNAMKKEEQAITIISMYKIGWE